MAAAPGLPPAEVLEKVLADLYGRPVGFKLLPRGLVEPPWVISLYAGKEGEARVLGICDLPFASSAGAALSMMPSAAAAESVTAGHLSDAILENFQEVMNVAAAYLSGQGVRVALREIVNPPDMAPPDLLRRALTSKVRLDAEVSLPDYAGGRLSFAAV